MMRRHSIYKIDASQQILLRDFTTFEATRVVELFPFIISMLSPKRLRQIKKYAHYWQLHCS